MSGLSYGWWKDPEVWSVVTLTVGIIAVILAVLGAWFLGA